MPLAIFGVVLLGAVYVWTMWAAYVGRLNPHWAPVLATTAWRSWGLRKGWAWGLTRGVLVFYQVSLVLCLAMACSIVAFSASDRTTALAWGLATLALVVVGLIGVPTIAINVGLRGRPESWIHPDVRNFGIDDF